MFASCRPRVYETNATLCTRRRKDSHLGIRFTLVHADETLLMQYDKVTCSESEESGWSVPTHGNPVIMHENAWDICKLTNPASIYDHLGCFGFHLMQLEAS